MIKTAKLSHFVFAHYICKNRCLLHGIFPINKCLRHQWSEILPQEYTETKPVMGHWAQGLDTNTAAYQRVPTPQSFLNWEMTDSRTNDNHSPKWGVNSREQIETGTKTILKTGQVNW